MKNATHLVLTTVLGCSCVLGLSQVGEAQGPVDLATIKRQIDSLGERQELILKKLNDLESRLAANGPDTNPQLPVTTDVRGESFRGESSAQIVVVEYGDYECPFCNSYEQDTFPRILKDYIQTGRIRYIYRDLPLHHPHAMLAARASRCAAEQGKYWEMHDALFASRGTLVEEHLSELAASLGLNVTDFSACLASERYTNEIQAGVSQAERLGLSGTPSFLIGTLENGGATMHIEKRIVGALPYELFKSDLDGIMPTKPTPLR